MVFDLVILQESHVPGVEPHDPGGHRPRQPDIEQATPAGREPAFAPIARFVPPAALFPRVSGQREQPPRRRHRRKIERDTRAMQIHGRLEHAFEFAFAAGRRDHRCLPPRAIRHSWVACASAGCALISSQTSTPKSASASLPARNAPAGECHAPSIRRRRFRRPAFAGHGAEKRNGRLAAVSRSASAASSASAAGRISG